MIWIRDTKMPLKAQKKSSKNIKWMILAVNKTKKINKQRTANFKVLIIISFRVGIVI